MKHFIVFIKYTAGLDKIDEILPEHRKFLQTGYDKGLLLFSGPMNPRTGGIAAARGQSADEIKSFFSNDPYSIGGCAEYNIMEFNPVKRQNFLDDWVNGE